MRALQVGGVDQSGLPGGLAAVRYDLAVLLLMGAAACVSAAMMFRWDVRSGHERGRRLGWLGVTLAVCLAVGFVTQRREAAASSGEPAVSATESPAPLPPPTSTPAVVLAPPPSPVAVSALTVPAPVSTAWQSLRRLDLEQVDRHVPPDDGVVAPLAGPDEVPDPETKAWVELIRDELAHWSPAKAADPVQRVRNLLYVLAVPDVMQFEPLERFLPAMIQARLQQEFPRPDLEKLLGWIALHPGEGSLSAIDQLIPLGIEVRTDRFDDVRERTRLYATKFLIRLQGG